MNSFELTGRFCLHNKTVVLSQTETSVVVGLCNDDEELRKKIEREFRRRTVKENTVLEFKKIGEDEWQRSIAKLFSKNLIGPTDHDAKKRAMQGADDAPIINLLNSIIIECQIQKGSDIHIEYTRNYALVRYRIQGYLYEQMQISAETADAVIQRIKLLSKLELAEKRKCQDGRFDFKQQDYSIDIRVSCVPSYFGESVVLRLLDRKAELLSLRVLGFSTEQLVLLERIKSEENGLVLICGATGSGKTTTVSSLLYSMEKTEKKIISIEDPVEYIIDGVIQVPVQPEMGMDFMDVLRRIYRQDPDVIVIGEIRDELTAQTAVRSAMTGHLVLATLHTCTAQETICRLLDMGIQQYMLAPVLKWIIVQKLEHVEKTSRKLKATITECNDEIRNAVSCSAGYDVMKTLFEKYAKGGV